MADEVVFIEEVNNCPVVQVAGRRFPGIVVQGDSLSILVDLAAEVVRLFDANELNEARETATELHSLLSARLRVYTQVTARINAK
jgi:hypothetical protein